MLKKIVETIVAGTIGFAALYVVAKLSYNAGHEIAQTERYCEELAKYKNAEESTILEKNKEEGGKTLETPCAPKPVKKYGKLNLFLGIKSMMGRGSGNGSVLGDLVEDPEGHKLEAYINEGEVHINIKKRTSVTARKENNHVV